MVILITFFFFTNLFFSILFFSSYQDTTRTILEAYSGTSLGETEVNIMSGAGELSKAGCAGCKTAYQIIDIFHKLSAERNNFKIQTKFDWVSRCDYQWQLCTPKFFDSFHRPCV